jgi:hypothetical protein
MKHTLLMTTTAIALAAATSFALAQAPTPDSGRGAATIAPSAAPADKSSTGQAPAPAATKQAPGVTDQKSMPGAAVKADDKAALPKGVAEQRTAPATPGAKIDGKAELKSEQAAPKHSAAPDNAASKNAQGTVPTASPRTSGAAGDAQAPVTATAPRTSGSANASLSSEQSAQVRSLVVNERNAPRVASPTFSINVGSVVPRHVRYVALPSRVISIYPAWRGYAYFLVGDQILVVNPRSHRIVAVLAA